MKINMRKPKPYFGCYHLVDLLLSWAVKEETVDKISEWLEHGCVLPPLDNNNIHEIAEQPRTRLARFFDWVHDKRNSRDTIKIEPWDTWSFDVTLARIIVPALKQLRDSSRSFSLVDDEDVPDELRSNLTEEERSQGVTTENCQKKWKWVLDKMIQSFEHVSSEDNFDMIRYTTDGGFDYEQYQKEVQEGIRLFGKYYSSLWD